MPMRSLLATWFPRVDEIITLIGSHNLLATPSRARISTIRRCARCSTSSSTAPTGSTPSDGPRSSASPGTSSARASAARNLLYERFYLTSASRNRITAHATNTDRSRAYELVDGILHQG